MNTQSRLLAGVVGAVMVTGCGEGAGLLVRPVPADQRLREIVVQADPGWISDKVALIDVEGLILNQRSSSLWASGENPVALFAEKLDKAAGDGCVKAVVLRINSPGGTVQASEAMHARLTRFLKESRKPVVTCITDVGASGAYYLACGTKRIICQESSITGSIGVIVQTVSFAGTMRLLGITAEAIKSGEMKDMGSPLKELTPEQRRIFQAMVDEFYGRFVQVVAEGRPALGVEKVRALADGRVYTGTQALGLGLVDRLGGLQDALAEAKGAAGIRKAKVVMYDRPLGYRANVYSAVPSGVQLNLLNLQGEEVFLLRRPTFLYLWSSDLPGSIEDAP